MGNDSTKVYVANLALSMIGGQRITSFNDDSREARSVTAVYDSVRDTILGSHPWSFAKKRVLLTTLSGTPAWTTDNLKTIYARPNDMIRLLYVNSDSAKVVVEGNQILSDTAGLGIIYIYQNDDPTTYFSEFMTALATLLAHRLCFYITESASYANDLLESYTALALPAAKSHDSQQGTPDRIINNEWDNARLVGGNTLIVPPGSQTWHPIL